MRKDVFIDGHERSDIVERLSEFSKENERLQALSGRVWGKWYHKK